MDAIPDAIAGNVFEKRLIEQYIRENGTDPVNGEELTVEDLIDLKQSRVVRPRPPTHTSIPALLASFQNEWDALILETYQLKQQLAETRQELSTSLYYNDSAEKVIARLQRERDEARDALSKVTISSTNGANGHGADAMQVDSQGLPDSIIARIDQTQQQYVEAEQLNIDTHAHNAIDYHRLAESVPFRKPGSQQRNCSRSVRPPAPARVQVPLARVRSLSTLLETLYSLVEQMGQQWCIRSAKASLYNPWSLAQELCLMESGGETGQCWQSLPVPSRSSKTVPRCQV